MTFNKYAEQDSKSRWDSIAKPIGGLGLLENMISKIVSKIFENSPPVSIAFPLAK